MESEDEVAEASKALATLKRQRERRLSSSPPPRRPKSRPSQKAPKKPADESRERRKERNRLAAAASRERKRRQMDELREKVQHLQDSKTKLSETVATLGSENVRLREELEWLKTLVDDEQVGENCP